ncbi:MAG: F0F1 ATP synthase subunit epsilon, partial [Candidatus Kryptoniota bacterium]
LQIITPQKNVFSGSVESFWAPGISGGFQILHDHAPFLTTITIGEVKLRNADGNELSYSTSGGFVDVSNNNVTFLADTAERKDEIDVERAKSAKARAEERLRKKEEDINIARARAALARAINRLRITDAL